MTALSNANTSGLEVVAWMYGYTHDQTRQLTLFEGQATDKTGWHQPLVTAASAQARIDAAEARADRLAKALEPFAVPHECDGHATVEDFNMEVQIFVRWEAIKSARAALQQETQP